MDRRHDDVEPRESRRARNRTLQRCLGGAAMGLLSAGLGAGLVACVDLFHSTSGILSACEIDAQACDDGGPNVEAGPPGTDFCMWPPGMARYNAEHACAWLGACETPMGGNAFGTCMFNALLAYDCAANPSHPAQGHAHALWDCLWQVTTCDDVTRCIFPNPPGICPPSAQPFTSCDPKSPDLRVQCSDGGTAAGESCALEGQTCAKGSSGTCAGASAAAGGLSCEAGTASCDGTHLHQCNGSGIDQGIDCASNGAQQCGYFPSQSQAGWVACAASGDAGCTPSDVATCSGGSATSCSSGIVETVNCGELFESSDAGCVEGALSPTFDWTSPCQVVPPECDADTCDGTAIVGCARGATFTASCAGQGFATCAIVATDALAAMHAACTNSPSDVLDGGGDEE